MQPLKPILDNIELQQVQNIEGEEKEVRAQHAVPALEGDFLQDLGRRAACVTITGVMTGSEVRDGLKNLREKFRDAKPVPFVADIATATKVDKVLIEELGVRDLAGKPERFEYALTLREFVPPPKPEQEPPPPIPPPPRKKVDSSTLIVEVVVENEPGYDYSKITVTVDGTQQEGNIPLDRRLNHRVDNRWTEEEFPSGRYTARAVAALETPPLPPGAANVELPPGEIREVQIRLRRDKDRPVNVAIGFVIHFWFDKSFVEPCMRHVLRRIMDYARAHRDEKLLIVGNTDEMGSADYNLSLGDRRARSVYAYLTFGRDPQARAESLAEWNLLRLTPLAAGTTAKDSWGTRQYQYMLQSLGFYPSNVDGKNNPMTIAAIKDFQAEKGLPVTGFMDDATWSALIEDYMSQDEAVMDLPISQLFKNCPDEPLKWLSCGEQRPLSTTPFGNGCQDPGQIAWRPNRRAEFLFTPADDIPTRGSEPKPVTFDRPSPTGVGKNWCLGPDDPKGKRCAFLVENCPSPASTQWCIQRAEPGSIRVSGSIVFEDGEPLGNTKYVLIAPDGKFMDGEKPCGADRGRPVQGRTREDGTFKYTEETTIGIYTLEIELPSGPHAAYAASRPRTTARGSVVCKRLDEKDTEFKALVIRGPASRVAVNPTITPATSAVVVKKSYTHPSRRVITLGTDGPFDGKGVLTRSSPIVRFFSAATGDAEVLFDATGRAEFPGQQLTAGLQLFAEGDSPSAAMDDVILTLKLSSPDQLVGPPATATMTSVELTLDICGSRPSLAVDPVPLSTAEKIDPGRWLPVRDPNNTHERAMLIVRRAKPETFTGNVVLLQIASVSAQLQIFAETDEVPAPGQIPLPLPQIIPSGSIPLMTGLRFWAEGVSPSKWPRDTGFRLGLEDIPEGDFVAITVASFTLRVEGATQIAGTNVFVTTHNPSTLVTIIADVTPVPSPLPPDFITWSPNVTPTADPLRRTLSRNHIAQTIVTATIHGLSRSVDIRVINIMLTTNAPPFNQVAVASLDQQYLVQADIPGETRDEITIEIASYLIKR